MSALELADLISLLESEAQTTTKINSFIKNSAATMLRQQQAEIEELKLAKKVILRYAEKDIAKYRAEVEELKKQLALWKLSKSSEEIEQVGTNPTSVGGLDELVAWIDKNTGKPRMEGFVQTDYDIPLYTHPSKDLTDEEIEAFAYAFELWQMNNPDKVLEGIIDFARALLEKAQEK